MISRIQFWSWDLTDESDWLGGVGVRAILRRRKQQCSLREELPLLWLLGLFSFFFGSYLFFFSSLFSSVTLSYPCSPRLVTLGLSCCAQAFPSCSEDGLLPRCGVRSSRCRGSSCGSGALPAGRRQQLQRVGSVAVFHGLRCPLACRILVPRSGTQPCPLPRQAESQPRDHQGRPLMPSSYKWASLMNKAIYLLPDH